MGVLEQLTRKSGVIVGDDVLRLFEYAKEKGFAIPAIVSSLIFFFKYWDRVLTLP